MQCYFIEQILFQIGAGEARIEIPFRTIYKYAIEHEIHGSSRPKYGLWIIKHRIESARHKRQHLFSFRIHLQCKSNDSIN